MRGKDIMTLIMLLWSWALAAQSQEDIDMMLRLKGYESEEELTSYEAEVLQEYLVRPVKINTSRSGALRSCGLFTAYQAASLTDYRMRHGDIMSLKELSSLDGFTDDRVAALAPFISLEGGIPAYGGSSAGNGFCDVAIKGGIRAGEVNYGFKCKGGTSGGLTYGIGLSRSYSAKHLMPESITGNLGWEGSGIPLRLIIGDFNLRFGQGLCLWNGMSMGGLSKASSFYRSGTGLSSSWSFTGSNAFTGIAGEYEISHLRVTSAVIAPGIKSLRKVSASVIPAINLGWFGRNMSVSATHYLELAGRPVRIPDMKTSADFAACIRGIDLFSEMAFDWASGSLAVLGGCTFPAWESSRMAAHLRYYPPGFNPTYSGAPRSTGKCSNEIGATYCIETGQGNGTHSGSLSLDAAYFPENKGEVINSCQIKMSTEWNIRFSESLLLKLRLCERYRTWEERRFKTDFRADFSWTGQRWSISSRMNVVNFVGTGFLGYMEGGYKRDKFSTYLKLGLYLIENWDDRIYSYERNGPGNFSVPAFHGKGSWATLYTSWKFSKWGKLYCIETVKPGKAELKLQLMLSF